MPGRTGETPLSILRSFVRKYPGLISGIVLSPSCRARSGIQRFAWFLQPGFRLTSFPRSRVGTMDRDAAASKKIIMPVPDITDYEIVFCKNMFRKSGDGMDAERPVITFPRGSVGTIRRVVMAWTPSVRLLHSHAGAWER
jgi:hypothetical protein